MRDDAPFVNGRWIGLWGQHRNTRRSVHVEWSQSPTPPSAPEPGTRASGNTWSVSFHQLGLR